MQQLKSNLHTFDVPSFITQREDRLSIAMGKQIFILAKVQRGHSVFLPSINLRKYPEVFKGEPFSLTDTLRCISCIQDPKPTRGWKGLCSSLCHPGSFRPFAHCGPKPPGQAQKIPRGTNTLPYQTTPCLTSVLLTETLRT